MTPIPTTGELEELSTSSDMTVVEDHRLSMVTNPPEESQAPQVSKDNFQARIYNVLILGKIF